MDKKPLIILTGPTAVGKSSLSISLAKRINAEIISADSMQVYKGMNIGTAKIKPEEMKGVAHYLIDELEPDEEFNVVKFKQMARFYMEQIYAKGKIPLLVGGTAFYIQAVLYDIDFDESDSDSSYRDYLSELARQKGNEYLHNLLREKDPESAAVIHPNNLKRVIRALEYIKQTGKKISEHNREQKAKASPYNFCYFVLNRDRATLYDSINKRVDQMIKEGLINEVKALMEAGFSRDLVSMQGLGYKELIAYLNGEYSLEEAIEILKRDTRHFAKRQLTWFKHERDVIWINKDDFSSEEEILAYMTDILNSKFII